MPLSRSNSIFMFPLPPLFLFSGTEALGWQLGSRGTLVARTREAAGNDAKHPTLPGAAGRRFRFRLYILQRAGDVTVEHLREGAASQFDDVKPISRWHDVCQLGCAIRSVGREGTERHPGQSGCPGS